MNAKVLSSACFFVGGILLGMSIGISIGKKMEKKDMEEKLKELRDHYNRKTKCRENEEKKEEIYNDTILEYTSGNVKEHNKKVEETLKNSADYAEKLVSKIISEKKEVEKILSEGEHPEEEYDEDMDNDEIDRVEWEHKSIWNSDKKEPYIITFKEYEDHPELDKITLIYYTVGGTLTTEDDEMIEDVKGTVGTCIDDSDFGESEDRVMFIRNKRLGSDFEITKFEGSFY